MFRPSLQACRGTHFCTSHCCRLGLYSPLLGLDCSMTASITVAQHSYSPSCSGVLTLHLYPGHQHIRLGGHGSLSLTSRSDAGSFPGQGYTVPMTSNAPLHPPTSIVTQHLRVQFSPCPHSWLCQEFLKVTSSGNVGKLSSTPADLLHVDLVASRVWALTSVK